MNISEITKLYGGGGHKKMAAATFKKKFNYYQMLATVDDYLSNHNFSKVTIRDRV